MAIEIERKFLVLDETWRTDAQTLQCEQGYLLLGPPVSVRVRIMGDTATINIKHTATALTRHEYQYPIPQADARELLDNSCQETNIKKQRHHVKLGDFTWEIDEFEGENQGLIVAEIELESEDQQFPRPAWLGEEVTNDPRYLNAALTQTPYTTWK